MTLDAHEVGMRRHPIPFRSSLDALRRLKSGQLAHKDVEDLDGRDEAEAEEEPEDAADGADEGHLGDLLLGDEHRHVRVLDEDLNFGKILLGVPENFLAKS